jgi:hypothetical protein
LSAPRRRPVARPTRRQVAAAGWPRLPSRGQLVGDPKPHGCVRAEFVVDADVPADLRHGIFAAPRTYPAWIRFSSSFAPPRSDDKRDAHGMAIKLMDVPGAKVLAAERDATTQDFVLANNPVFFCRNASDYVVLATNAAQGHFARFFLRPRPRPRELLNLMRATQKRVTNPLRIRYWSQTPSALGPHAVKYSATPRPSAAGVPVSRPRAWGDNELEAVMARELAAGEALFDFMVQRQTDPAAMPVEDPTIPGASGAPLPQGRHDPHPVAGLHLQGAARLRREPVLHALALAARAPPARRHQPDPGRRVRGDLAAPPRDERRAARRAGAPQRPGVALDAAQRRRRRRLAQAPPPG